MTLQAMYLLLFSAHALSLAITTPLDELRACAASLPHSEFEQATLAVVELFEKYAVYDQAHLSTLAQSFAAFHRHQNITPADTAEAQAAVDQELSGMKTIISQALDECNAISQGRHRPVPPPISLFHPHPSSGFLVDSRNTTQPVFPQAYNMAPAATSNTTQLSSTLQINIIDANTLPAALFPTSSLSPSAVQLTHLNQTVQAAAQTGAMVQFFVGNGREPSNVAPGTQVMPLWAEQAYPGLLTSPGTTTFFSYDIDNPGARVIFDAYFNATLPVLMAGSPNRLFGVSLANEPAFHAASSNHTLAKFVVFVKTLYQTVGALNDAWGMNLTSFEDAGLREAMGNKVFSQRQRLEWDMFNRQRVTAWFKSQHDAVQRVAQAHGHTSPVLTYVKSSNGVTAFHSSYNGIDRVALSDVLGGHGCDTRAQFSSESHFSFPQYPHNVFGMDWLSITGSYSLMRTFNRSKPVIDNEWHVVSTVHFRTMNISSIYMETCAFLAHLHGLTWNQIWYWGRSKCSEFFFHTCFFLLFLLIISLCCFFFLPMIDLTHLQFRGVE